MVLLHRHPMTGPCQTQFETCLPLPRNIVQRLDDLHHRLCVASLDKDRSQMGEEVVQVVATV